jgi:hypothetical protein
MDSLTMSPTKLILSAINRTGKLHIGFSWYGHKTLNGLIYFLQQNTAPTQAIVPQAELSPASFFILPSVILQRHMILTELLSFQ